jgi:hypothetical protein
VDGRVSVFGIRQHTTICVYLRGQDACEYVCVHLHLPHLWFPMVCVSAAVMEKLIVWDKGAKFIFVSIDVVFLFMKTQRCSY